MATAADIEAIYRTEARPALATLIRLLGGFDLAEEALHDAWLAALAQWPRDGIPTNPRSWLISTGRFKAIDKLRRKGRFEQAQPELMHQAELAMEPEVVETDHSIADDQLRLIFVCCHPALAPDAQVALTLREVGGLTTEDIAAAYFSPAPTIAQRIVRAKAKIRDANIPYVVPEPAEFEDRLEAVLQVIYLIFNAGYSAASGASAIRADLCAEAIRLARLLTDLVTVPEADGLLALLLLTDARRAARLTPSGDLIALPDQDRSLWDHEQIGEGVGRVRHIFRHRRFGAYALQAAIAAEHGLARTADATNWAQIVVFYDLLLRLDASAIVELNRAVAVSMRDGPQPALVLVDAILSRGELADYHLAHATRADLLAKLGRTAEAKAAYEIALGLARQEPEIRFLKSKLADFA
ncbi:RNA polymerase sigma factor [Devosia sp.]|uniref:RNA polymerase sigma factor n=1 Tax=Devosia sp. TaxID=1871048 RepID=UPI0032646FEB